MRVTALACVVLLCAGSSPAAPDTQENGVIAYRYQGPVTPYSLWVVLPDGSGARQKLRLGQDSSFDPHWSSDGRRLVFSRASGIYIAETTGDTGIVPSFSPPRRIASFSAEFGLDWSPDGTSLLVTREIRRRLCSDLFTVRSDGSAVRRLTSSVECEKHPAWSPDGGAIAYEKEGDQNTEIVVSYIRGGGAQTVGLGTYPAWSPDGRSLAFLSNGAIEVFDAPTLEQQRTLQPEEPWSQVENGLTWSPDGRRLAYGFHDPEETFPLTHLAAIDADGTNTMRLTPSTTFPDTDPDWRPVCDVYGTQRRDRLVGSHGNDSICALRGSDLINAGEGDDVGYGGDGADLLVGGPGADWFFGAAGDDRIYARDGVADLVDGGPGVDRAVVDAADRVSGVERVDRG
jgi:hypothetical protein